MPTFSRAAQINVDSTPYYHCVSRCVRRAFLCGEDPYTGESFEHRKPWLVERLRLVAEVFTIDVCAYAVLSNHFHVVLRVDTEAELTDEAVLRRYGKLFARAAAEARALPEPARKARVQILRERLADISWFMRAVNEFIARLANKEDKCTGRFWEGRFKSQALLDERALLTAMSYVDLNPVRAGLADDLAGSAYTSIKQRLEEADGTPAADDDAPRVGLAPLGAEGKRSSKAVLPIRFDDYKALVEWTGRIAGKKSNAVIKDKPPALLAEHGINAAAWLSVMQPAALLPAVALGSEEKMAAEAERRDVLWVRGSGIARDLYGAAG
jgi:REP element-mobilizing transposase RayT